MENKINWKSRDYQRKERSINWYWIFWAIVLFFIFLFIYFYKDYIFAGLIFMLGVLITISNLKKPKIFECVVTDSYFLNKTMDEKILFENVQYYNIDEENFVILIKEKESNFFPKTLPFEPNQNMKKIDMFLSKKLKKNEEYVYPTSLVVLHNLLGI